VPEQNKDMMLAEKIAEQVSAVGGRVYYVGGCVRDALLGVEGKDIDIEVHGISPASLEEILDKTGMRTSFGESFGIYAIKGHSLDIAMPRKEKLHGRGHRDFDVFVDPFIGVESAAKRRDFTVNAIMRDVLTGEIIDPFGGAKDLEKGILRHVSDDSFGEDPLRVLRLCQFAARFGFSVADETLDICKKMDISTLSRERVEGEMKKALLKSEKPSVFFELLRKIGKLSPWFGELLPLIGLEQDARYHMEGDVWTHTMMVLDAAAELKDNTENPYGFMLAALCHDLGKAVCTVREGERVHSYGHDVKGIPIARRLLHRFTDERKLIRYVLEITEHHMKPNVLASNRSAIKKTNKMFDCVSDPMALIMIAAADVRGQRGIGVSADHTDFLLDRLEVYRKYMAEPYVTGKDLLAAGVPEGEQLKSMLEYAHKLRLAGVDKDSALMQTLRFYKSNK